MALNKTLLVLGVLMAAVLLLSSEVTARELEETKDQKYGGYQGGGGGYRNGGGGRYQGGGGGYKRGGGGGGRYKRGGGGRGCSYGCCNRGYSGCSRCCASPDEIPDPEYLPEPKH